jgi:hypothetical protein
MTKNLVYRGFRRSGIWFGKNSFDNLFLAPEFMIYNHSKLLLSSWDEIDFLSMTMDCNYNLFRVFECGQIYSIKNFTLVEKIILPVGMEDLFK